MKEYVQKREKAQNKIEKLKKEFEKDLKKRKKELLKKLKSLENKKLPKGIDENLAKKILADRIQYVTSLKRIVETMNTPEDVEKKLPELAKLHVNHGRYLMVAFEREVYDVNRLLREINESYLKFLKAVERLSIPDSRVSLILDDIARTKAEIEENKKLLWSLQRELNELEKELILKRKEEGIETLKVEIEELIRKRKSVELEVRSKVSKLQKPLRRMRLGGLADEVARDSGVAIQRPKEFLELVSNMRNSFDGKAKKSAEWVLKNLDEKVAEVRKLEEEIAKRQRILEKKKESLRTLEDNIREIEREILEVEDSIKKLERKLEHLREELEEELKLMEEILGENVEVDF